MKEPRGVGVDEFLRIVLSLPEVERGGQWGGIRVCGKGFCYLYDDDEYLLLKATREEHAALVASDPLAYGQSRTTAKYGWVRIRLPYVRRDELVELVTDAWRPTAPKRLVAGYDAG
jgi:hypothetical protein